MWDHTDVDSLIACPPSGLIWAARGYRAGLRDGRDDVRREVGQAGVDVRVAAGAILRMPALAELEKRRQHRREPCPQRCQRCSRCVSYEAWWRRGQRDYLGVEREAELSNALDSSMRGAA